MRAHLRYLHAFSGFEGVFGHLVCSHIGHPLGWNPAGALPFRMCAHHLFLHAFSGFEGAVWAPVCRLESMGLCRVACVPTTGTSMLLAVSKVLFGHLVYSHIGHILLGLCRFACVPTIGASMFLAVSKACLGTSSAATLATPWAGILLSALSLFESYRLKVFPAVRTGAFRADFVASKKVRVPPFESVSSRPYGSCSCRFCGFQEGAFSMASYRSLRGSKGTLGLASVGRVGLESCWGSAVSDACPHRCLHAFSGFEGVFGHLVSSHNWPPLGLESCFLRFRFSSPTVWKCYQPSVRELFVPILWLPRRCVFDGFPQEFEGFKGYVRPLWGRLSLAGWAGILLGLCRFACVPTAMKHCLHAPWHPWCPVKILVKYQ